MILEPELSRKKKVSHNFQSIQIRGSEKSDRIVEDCGSYEEWKHFLNVNIKKGEEFPQKLTLPKV